MTPTEPIVIIGAGPTGLGAAWRLTELGHRDWRLLEASDAVGGLAASVRDDQGFTWDLGGHVLFSHYTYFDCTMHYLLGDAWVQHDREAWVWMRERFIPYPLQNNIWRLPNDDLLACLRGLLDVHRNGHIGPPANFLQWIQQSFGAGLADVFLVPYNTKVWAYPPAELNVDWMGERVAHVDLARVLENLVLRRDDCGWGPNARFRFPLHGGTGAIWQALAGRLPQDRLVLNSPVVRVHAGERWVETANGQRHRYGHLISTMPLDRLLSSLIDAPEPVTIQRPPNGDSPLRYSSSHVIGIGMEGTIPPALATKCWMYFPEEDVPFYRVTVFSNYSPNNVPVPGRQWSLMAEVSQSPVKHVREATVVEDVIAGLRTCGLLPPEAKIVSRWHRRLPYGYPTPFLGRNPLLEKADAMLRAQGIFSRGRFGGWKYEVSNQDHSFMQGVEAVDHLLHGAQEVTYQYPRKVNAGPKR